MKYISPIIFVAIILALGFWLIYRYYFHTYHLATVQSGVLYRDGVRSIREFQLTAQKTHIKTVVSLIDENEIREHPFTDEMAYCKANNITVVRVPVPLGAWPTGDQIAQFLSIANNPARQPVLVHCAQGVRRTGMMVAAYQLSVLKFDKSQTLAAMLTLGHSQRTVGDVQRFIDLYDPQTQRMTANLPTSQE